MNTNLEIHHQALRDFSTRYLALLENEYSSINLTNIKDPDEFYLKQIIDSIYPFVAIERMNSNLMQANYIVDIGFGGGFPILPLAILFPDKKFIGIEARSKKVKVVGEISDKLGINNVTFYHSRLEDIIFDEGDVLLTLKAVGKADSLLDKIYVKTEGPCDFSVSFLKGPGYSSNEAFYGNGLWDLEYDEEFQLNDELTKEQILRRILLFKLTGETSKKSKNKLVRFSQIIERF
ncbi:class I SAM-dependent methyltransferase [Bacteriovoracaceae bacterium]|nr:class I SAM-dependent methyltransferase [Bacteriovoracaceae bacterium]